MRRSLVLVYAALASAVLSGTRLVRALQTAFDQQLYQDVLDEQLCEKQLQFLTNHSLRYQFYDASSKPPSGILSGNTIDLGDFHQCLKIQRRVQDMDIHGKYCMIILSMNQDPVDWNITLPGYIGWPELPDNTTWTRKSRIAMKSFGMARTKPSVLAGMAAQPDNERPLTAVEGMSGLTLAVCIPHVCTTRQAIDFVQKRISKRLNISYQEVICRLPGDKPFAPADYVAIVIFSLIGLLIIISTTYDLMHTFHLKRKSSPLYRSFSLYTNTRRLLTFNPGVGALDCIDGIRTISMMWVVVGHTYSYTVIGFVHNTVDVLEWVTSFSSIWITAAPITVDTFFAMSGILLVYTVLDKIYSKECFVRSLPLFYLHRWLRVLPAPAAAALLQASLLHGAADGPAWTRVAAETDNCRRWWWTTLLHVQNYVNPFEICLPHSWYLAVDTQLYVISPLVLFWLWGEPRSASLALSLAILVSLASTTTISFMYNFSAALANFNRLNEVTAYFKKYYISILTRAPPFFIGMTYGYILHYYRHRKIIISKFNVLVLWTGSLFLMAFCIVSIYPVMQLDHTAQLFDNFLNSYMRALWATALGWQIFACAKGYGGPVNWFLSLRLWRLPARLSFAVYVLHVPLLGAAHGAWLKAHYFTSAEAFHRFLSNLLLSFLAAFAFTLCVDAPFSTIQKLMLGGGIKRPVKSKTDNSLPETQNEKFETKL